MVLEALYESVKAGNYSWVSDKDQEISNFKYPYVLFQNSFKEHLNVVAPDSKYNFLKYKKLEMPVRTTYFEVTTNGYVIRDFIDLGNPYLNKHAGEGNKYFILSATYKNIDNEGRTILSAGSLFIQYNGVEYEFDKTEIILSDDFNIVLETLNPLSRKTKLLVFPIANEIKGDVFWIPGGGNERVYLGPI